MEYIRFNKNLGVCRNSAFIQQSSNKFTRVIFHLDLFTLNEFIRQQTTVINNTILINLINLNHNKRIY